MRRFSMVLLGLLLTPETGVCTTAVSNFNNSDGIFPVPVGDVPDAISFTTGAQPATLNSISAMFYNQPNINESNQFYANLWSDAGGHPSAIIETYSQHLFPISNTVFTFTSSGVSLLPQTTYWFGMSASVPGSAYWRGTVLPSQDSSFGWTIGDNSSFLNPAPPAWTPFHTIEVPRISIDATILPEPSLLAASVLTLVAANRRRRR